LTAVLSLSVISPAVVKSPGHGYPDTPGFGGVMWQASWVLGHVLGAAALVGHLAIVRVIVRQLLDRNEAPLGRYVRAAALLFCSGPLGWLGWQTVSAAWDVTRADVNDPAWVEVGRFAREQLPDNAVLFCEANLGNEHLTTMFYADRTCYPLGGQAPDEQARQVLRAGGVPYVVTHRGLPLPAVYVSGRGPTVYLWQPQPP
jgi:hypothetical protein